MGYGDAMMGHGRESLTRGDGYGDGFAFGDGCGAGGGPGPDGDGDGIVAVWSKAAAMQRQGATNYFKPAGALGLGYGVGGLG